MRGRTPMKVAAGMAAIALFAAGCSDSTDNPAEEAGGLLRIYASEPAFLVPTAADDDPAIQVIRQIYRGLVTYNQETGKDELDLAESISSTDNITWTIKVKSGYKFANGEPVNADAFIRAWNYTAYAPNAQNNAYFMSKIKGIEDVSYGADPDGEEGPLKAPDPVAKELPGLKKVDDQTFTVELSAPFSGFPATVGYSGFFPVAQACLDDFKACNEHPIGNGPYMMDGDWIHESGIALVRNPDYAGADKGKVRRLFYAIYSTVDAGYDAFLAGELDVMYTIPPSKYKDAKGKFADHLYEKTGNSFTYVGFPMYNDNFKDKRVRQAFSLVIDRQAIIDALFDGRFAPAEGFVSGLFDGYRPGVCKYCVKDVDKAKALLAEAGGWKGGKLQLWANAGAGHDLWVKAVGDQIKANLGIDYELKINLEFPEYLALGDDNGYTGPFRRAWGPDYPVLETYLGPLYVTGGSANDGRFTNAALDEAVTKGNSAPSVAEGIAFYQQAEDIAAEEMPVIPMWFSKVAALYSENVTNFIYNPISGVAYGDLTVVEE